MTRFSKVRKRRVFCFFVAVLGLYLVGGRRYPVSATPTHTLRVCVNSPTTRYGRVEHRSPAKKHKETFLLIALFTDEKRDKRKVTLSYFSSVKSTIKKHL